LEAAIAPLVDDAEIDHEHVRDSRYRFMVVSPTFEKMRHPQRQRLVWDAAEKVLTRPEIRDVAMIITMAPTELASDEGGNDVRLDTPAA
jgi:acid stress-induced BolA-like protein IbaG/YrbA